MFKIPTLLFLVHSLGIIALHSGSTSKEVSQKALLTHTWLSLAAWALEWNWNLHKGEKGDKNGTVEVASEVKREKGDKNGTVEMASEILASSLQENSVHHHGLPQETVDSGQSDIT